MKTITTICATVLTLMVLFTACTKEDQDFVPGNLQNSALRSTNNVNPLTFLKNWTDDFASASAFQQNWTLSGPEPKWVANGFGRTGLFDNNGQLPNGSYAVSKTKVGDKFGYSVESDVYINIIDKRGAFICPQLGVTRFPNVESEPLNTAAGISMKLAYIGTDIEGVPAELQNHVYVIMEALTSSDGSHSPEGFMVSSGDYTFRADNASNGWHRMKIEIDATNKVSFYLDGQLVWSPAQRVHPSMLSGKNILLGYTSPDLKGKAYHDFVRVDYKIIAQESGTDNPTGNAK